MLLPALSRTKETARRALCISGQHQLVVGMLSYADDYDGFLPPGARDNGAEHCIWISTLVHDVMGAVPLSNPSDHTNGEDPTDLWVCPSLPGGFGRYGSPYGWVSGYNYLGSHPLAANLGGWETAITTADEPDLPVICDLNNWSTGNWTFVAHTRGGGIDDRSGLFTASTLGSEGGVVSYLDGSVRWKPLVNMNTYTTGQFAGENYPAMW
jgi:hypothetical protein